MQFQDRQKSRELKDELVAKLDEATTRTVIATRILVDRSSSQAQTTIARELELKNAREAERAGARAALLAALEQERSATAELYIRLISDWLVTRSVTRSQLVTYFPDSSVANDWTEYANHVTLYVRLASTNPKRLKLEYVLELARYLGVEALPPDWRLLARDPRMLTRRQFRRFATADGELTELLLRKKNALVFAVVNGHAAGFSTDSDDLLRDLLPIYG